MIDKKNDVMGNTLYFGYARLSRDEDKSNYASITAQKDMIKSFVFEKFNIIITDKEIYEDDNVSGYTFDRPDYNRLLKDIDNAIENGKNVVIVTKDLSRIGRNNPQTLLFLEDMKRKGVRVILISDNYDSFVDDDDVIGIKSWYNERYVKDISKKVKANIRMRMASGSYLTPVPYGYKRNPLKPDEIIIDEETAPIVRKIFQMYLQGDGYRKICIYLTANKIPTPSMVNRRKREDEGKAYKKQVTEVWVQRMIQRIIRNDFYTGVLRLGKYKLNGINGKIQKTDLSEQFVFENHHEPIISKADFELAQMIAEKRLENNYRGKGNKHLNLFSGFLVCEDCGKGMVALNKEGKHKAYICGTYRRVGKIACSTHYILDRTLMLAIKAHLRIIRENLSAVIQQFDSKVQETISKANNFKKFETSLMKLQAKHDQLSNELRVIIKQKAKAMASNPELADISAAAYEDVEVDLQQQIAEVNRQIRELTDIMGQTSLFQQKAKTALSVFDSILAKEKLDRKDLEILIDKITVNENKEPTIYLKANIERLLRLNNDYDPDGGNKITVSYKAGAVKKSLVSKVALPKEENKADFLKKEPLCTTKPALTASRASARCLLKGSKATFSALWDCPSPCCIKCC